MPAANIMAIHPPVENSGCSPSRPNRMWPNLENARAIIAMKKTMAQMMNTQPNSSTTHWKRLSATRLKLSGTLSAHTAMPRIRPSAGSATPQSSAAGGPSFSLRPGAA